MIPAGKKTPARGSVVGHYVYEGMKILRGASNERLEHKGSAETILKTGIHQIVFLLINYTVQTRAVRGFLCIFYSLELLKGSLSIFRQPNFCLRLIYLVQTELEKEDLFVENSLAIFHLFISL